MKKNSKLDYIPEILYEAPSYPGEKVSPIPYMEIPKDKDMPSGLFILEYKNTGEYEISPQGKAEPIMEGPFPHMYVEFEFLKENIKKQFPTIDDKVLTDKIRIALGLKPLQEAKEKGEQILSKVISKEEDLKKAKEELVAKTKLNSVIGDN